MAKRKTQTDGVRPSEELPVGGMREKPDILADVAQQLEDAENTAERRVIVQRAILEAIIEVRDAILIGARILPVHDDVLGMLVRHYATSAGIAVEDDESEDDEPSRSG